MSVTAYPRKEATTLLDSQDEFNIPEFLREEEDLHSRYEVLPSRLVKYQPRNTVYIYGDTPEVIFVVQSGAVILTREFLDASGELREECVGLRGPGEAFGALRDEEVHFEDAETLTGTSLKLYLRDHVPERLLMREMQRQLSLAYEILSIAQGATKMHRVARALLVLQRKYEAGAELALTHSALARIVMSTRESVSKAIIKLREERIIDTERRSVHILDTNKLAVLAGYAY